MAKDPAKIFAKWKANMTSPSTVQTIKDGVAAVTVAPGKTAADHESDYIKGVQEKVKKWATRVAAVSLEDWQTDMTSKGITNMSSGVGSASTQKKDMAFLTAFLPFADAVKQYAKRLPGSTYLERKQRSWNVQTILQMWNPPTVTTLAQAVAAAQASGEIQGSIPNA